MRINLKKGAILLEVLLALAIGSVILTAVFNALVGSQQANLRSYQNQQAELYLQEASEVVKSVALSGWSAVADNGIFHPEIVADDWDLIDNEEVLLDFYTREVEISDVFRDGSGNIATSGGTLDPSTKKVTVSVSWPTPRPGLVSQSFFLTRWRENITWTEDTLADFSDGFEDATDMTTNPGYIQLAQTGGGGWTEPGSIGTIDAREKASGICATDSYVYLTGDKLVGEVEIFDIQSSPATPSSVGYFGTTYRPNDCTSADGYLYVANSLPVGSINIYDVVTDPLNPNWVGARGLFYQAGGLWATDDYLFVNAKSEDFIVVYQFNDNYSNPQYVGWFNTPEDTVDIAATGNYLYVAQESTSQAVEIYDISVNPVSPTHMATLSTLYEPTGIWTESNILYLSMESKRGAMYSIAANPTSPQLYGYFPTVRNTADIAAFGDYGYVAGSDSQLKAIEVFNLADSKGISGIYFVYGEYISNSLDVGSEAAFNRISWEGEEVPNTNILFQIAVNNDDFTWSFVGPDGTGGSYYQDSGTFPLTNMIGSYMKYKAILTGDGDVTPTVDKVRINYSP